MKLFERIRQWCRRVKQDAHAPRLAARDPRVPWHAKLLAVCVAANALSPIDLIPGFISVLGYVDDMILVPLGIAMVVWMIPKEIMVSSTGLLQPQPLSPSVWAGLSW
jgi:uncharacterized membrane protein YkvA (DUF1232 family)